MGDKKTVTLPLARSLLRTAGFFLAIGLAGYGGYLLYNVLFVLIGVPLTILLSPFPRLKRAVLAFSITTALAFLIYFHLIREWGAVRASAVTYVAPIIALFWDYVFFKNVPDRFEIVGVAAVLSGVVLLHAPAAPKPAPE